MPKGLGQRCAGITLDFVSYCTREEYAGPLPLDLSTEPAAYKHQLYGECGCGREHHLVAPPTVHTGRNGYRRTHDLPLESRHEIFAATLGLLDLRNEAATDLTRRGLTSEDIKVVGYKSIPASTNDRHRLLRQLVDEFGEDLVRLCPGFLDKEGQTSFWSAGRRRANDDGYIVPYRNEAGLITGLQLKYLGGHYETARNSHTNEIYHVAGRLIVGTDLYLTEGGLKAQVAHRLGGVTVVGLPGQSLASEHLAVLARFLPARVIEALDHEANPTTDKARERWLHSLAAAGLPTYRAVWEGQDVGGPKGIDDLFAAGGRPRLRAFYMIPTETGERRVVREALTRGHIEEGLLLMEAQRLTSKAITEFVAKVRLRR